MSIKMFLLMMVVCLASVLLILVLTGSAYIAISFKWLLIPIAGWGIARLIYHFREKGD